MRNSEHFHVAMCLITAIIFGILAAIQGCVSPCEVTASNNDIALCDSRGLVSLEEAMRYRAEIVQTCRRVPEFTYVEVVEFPFYDFEEVYRPGTYQGSKDLIKICGAESPIDCQPDLILLHEFAHAAQMPLQDVEHSTSWWGPQGCVDLAARNLGIVP